MAIRMEFFNIVLQKATVARLYPGGLTAFRRYAASTCWEDDHLIRAGAMSWLDVERIVKDMEKAGLQYLDKDGEAQDLVVVDMIRGPLARCEWINFDQGEGPRCWLRGAAPGPLIKPDRPAEELIVALQKSGDTFVPVWSSRRAD